MPNLNVNIDNMGLFVSVTSLSQNRNAASKIDMVFPTTQNPDVLTLPRIPGSGKEYIVRVAPDFDAPFEFGS
jgi:hypothetical protein